MDNEYIRFENVRKEFPGVVALSDISFSVRKGEVHALGSARLYGLYDREAYSEIHRRHGNCDRPFYLREIYEFALRIARPRSTHLVIEEPEQNLYPTTQRDLMLMLISQLSAQAHCESVTITTHSPYVLSTLNVLMAASKLIQSKKQLPDGIDGIVLDMLLDIDDYAAFSVNSDGSVCDIVDRDLHMISGNNLDGVSDWVDDNISRIYQVLYG